MYAELSKSGNSNINENTGTHGGGISFSGNSLTVTSSTISFNTATETGGGLNTNGSVTITNSTITENTAVRGGAIGNSGTLTLNNSTLVNNNRLSDRPDTAAGIENASGTATLQKTIVANNPPEGNCAGTGIISLGHNLESANSCGFTALGDLVNTDPQLGPLADNGGPTFTHALLPGSPAIDAGDNAGCPATDQRAVIRPADGDGDGTALCDIGAYELALAEELTINPNKGGDTGSVSVVINGVGFKTGATVKLARTGETEIVGEPVTVSEDGRTIAATFDLIGKTRGLWDVVVTNPDGEAFTLPEGFTIEEGRAAQPWVDIIGRDVIRIGREQTFNIVYGNRGNVDAVGVPLWIAGIPKDATFRLGFEITPPPLLEGQDPIDWSQVPVHIESGDEIVLPLVLPSIPPEFTGVLKIILKVSTTQPFELRTWVNPPFFQSPEVNPAWQTCLKRYSFALFEAVGLGPLGERCIGALLELNLSKFKNIFDAVKNAEQHPVWSFIQLLTQLHIAIFDAIDDLAAACSPGDRELVRAAGRLLRTVSGANKIIQTLLDTFEAHVDCKIALILEDIKKQEVRPVAAIDPNDKVGSRGAAEPQYLSGEEPLRYTVFFENVETATAPAQEVVITDQLDTTNVDLNTFSLGPIAFGNKQLIPPPGAKEYAAEVLVPGQVLPNVFVRVRASLDPDTGLLTWRFTSIDPATGQLPEDPLEGFLPPNVTPPEGDGSVLFTVKPKAGLATGTEVQNAAAIVFDTNPPIDTPVWFNTLDNDKPVSQVQPLAATQTSTSFEVKWSGTDVGAGVKDFTIFVSEDGGAFTPFIANTPDTSVVFTGQSGKTYAFYSVARDQTNNLEDAPTTADTTTQLVITQNQHPVADAGTDKTVRLGSLVTLDGSASSDPDNGPDPLSFLWTQTGGPVVALTGATTASPTFTPNEKGSYTLSLVVNDGQTDSAADSVAITVPILGDIDLDGDVDKNDLKLIRAARNKRVDGPNDLRDLNGDGKINARDVREARRLCTRRGCATG